MFKKKKKIYFDMFEAGRIFTYVEDSFNKMLPHIKNEDKERVVALLKQVEDMKYEFLRNSKVY